MKTMMKRVLEEVRAMRRELREVAKNVRSMKRDRMDEMIGRMRQSAREMLHASRGI